MFQRIELRPIDHHEPRHNLLIKRRRLAVIGLATIALSLGIPQCSANIEKTSIPPIATSIPESQTPVPPTPTDLPREATATATAKWGEPPTPTTLSTKTATATEVPPTSTPEATKMATATEVPTVPTPEVVTVGSEFYKPAFAKELEANVDGIKVNITIGLMSNITERALEPVKSFSPTNQAAVNEVGRFWLKMCAYNYMINHSEFGNPEEGSNFDNFFPKYEEIVRNGGGQLTLAGVNEVTSRDKNKREESWQVPPTDITLIFSDGRLPVVLTEKGSVYIAKNNQGKLVIASTELDYRILEDQNNYCKSPEQCRQYKGSAFTNRLTDAFDIVAQNNALLFRGSWIGSGVEYGAPEKVMQIWEEEYKKALFATPEKTFFLIQQ